MGNPVPPGSARPSPPPRRGPHRARRATAPRSWPRRSRPTWRRTPVQRPGDQAPAGPGGETRAPATGLRSASMMRTWLRAEAPSAIRTGGSSASAAPGRRYHATRGPWPRAAAQMTRDGGDGRATTSAGTSTANRPPASVRRGPSPELPPRPAPGRPAPAIPVPRGAPPRAGRHRPARPRRRRAAGPSRRPRRPRSARVSGRATRAIASAPGSPGSRCRGPWLASPLSCRSAAGMPGSDRIRSDRCQGHHTEGEATFRPVTERGIPGSVYKYRWSGVQR